MVVENSTYCELTDDNICFVSRFVDNLIIKMLIVPKIDALC